MRLWYDGLCLRLWTQPFDINVVSESRSWRQLVHSFSLLHILWRNPSESVRSEFDYISAGILSSFDFSVLSGCYDNTVKIHTLTGKELLTLPEHSAPVRCLCCISSGIVFCLWKKKGGASWQQKWCNKKRGRFRNKKWAGKKGGALPQREIGSKKSGGAAATRNGQYKKPGRCRNEKWAV